eukprot:TRINITY_DN21317_c0_g1_i1.p1 TRINITY_DN21317_c0_g1~~TRINITY_DN21317_c0_g1_i1.p1  ORF type:complete len:361 (+),score=92.33 TRINITY_DN21317_c0_g1_i1:104-1186(+)
MLRSLVGSEMCIRDRLRRASWMQDLATSSRKMSGAPPAGSASEHIIVALGGNALVQRGQPITVHTQRGNMSRAVSSLLPVLDRHRVTLVHGNGPQVGMLALQEAAYKSSGAGQEQPLDVLDAETEGMIGYLLEQGLDAQLGRERAVATMLTQIVVDPQDPAFSAPTKFIGPGYTEEQAWRMMRSEDLEMKKDGIIWRRGVPSPLPVRLIDQQLRAVKLLVENDCILICAGGGGIPVVAEGGRLRGVEAVIDKDHAAAMLGVTLGADALMILTDVKAVAVGFGSDEERWIRSASPEQMTALRSEFPDGSMGPKVDSAIEFVQRNGGWCAIGGLGEADGMLSRQAGTFVTAKYGEDHIEFYP